MSSSEKFVWREGPFTWIASLPKFAKEPNELFVQTQSPDNPVISRLCEKLLDIAGNQVVVWFEDNDANLMLTSGELIPSQFVVQKTGSPSKCHTNSARLWIKNPIANRIATGYGLSDDGMWRHHSWIVNRDGSLTETTVKRLAYFGVILNRRKSFRFSLSNIF